MVENSSETTSEVVIQGEQSQIVEIEIKPEKTKKPTGDEPCADQPLEIRIEALLLSSDRPLTEARMGDLLGLGGAGTTQRLRKSIDDLNEHYAKSSRSFRIEKLAGGWQMLTLSQFGPLLTRLHTDRQSSKLSHAALETLSIIAYRQPIIRAEIEAIRGVACGEVLRGLLERRLIKIVGRAEELGRPMLYGTTGEFLKVFGLARIEDLPDVEGLNPPSRKKSSGDAQASSSVATTEEPDPEPVENPAEEGDDQSSAPEK